MSGYLRDFLLEAQRLGIKKPRLRQGRGSIRFWGELEDGRHVVYYLAISPSDSRRAIKNAVADLRRQVKGIQTFRI